VNGINSKAAFISGFSIRLGCSGQTLIKPWRASYAKASETFT
jgi:hypothetical protein